MGNDVLDRTEKKAYTNNGNIKIFKLNLEKFIIVLFSLLLKKEVEIPKDRDKVYLFDKELERLNNNDFILSSFDNEPPFFLLNRCFEFLSEAISSGVSLLKKINENNSFFLPKYLYKYVSDESKYIENLSKGKLSFVEREQFDDIFDACCLDAHLSSRTRILCLSKHHKIHAMWGLYANKFKGYCFRYSTKDLIENILNDTKNGITILLGNKIIYTKSTSIFTPEIFKEIKKYTNVSKFINKLILCFKKENSWKFEKEYRFIIYSDIGFFKPYVDFSFNPLGYYKWDLILNSLDFYKIS